MELIDHDLFSLEWKRVKQYGKPYSSLNASQSNQFLVCRLLLSLLKDVRSIIVCSLFITSIGEISGCNCKHLLLVESGVNYFLRINSLKQTEDNLTRRLTTSVDMHPEIIRKQFMLYFTSERLADKLTLTWDSFATGQTSRWISETRLQFQSSVQQKDFDFVCAKREQYCARLYQKKFKILRNFIK